MVFTRQKERSGANPESPARTQPGTNIREVLTPRRTVFTQEQSELFIQRGIQYSQEEKGDKFHYLVLGLNDFSTDDDMKNPIVSWLLDFTLAKYIIHNFMM